MKMMKNLMALALAFTFVFVAGGIDAQASPSYLSESKDQCTDCHTNMDSKYDHSNNDGTWTPDNGQPGLQEGECGYCHNVQDDDGDNGYYTDDETKSDDTGDGVSDEALGYHGYHSNGECYECHTTQVMEPETHGGSLDCGNCHEVDTAHAPPTETETPSAFDPMEQDSDGDGLSDGEETGIEGYLDGYGTNEDVADTDRDGVNDGDEVTAGTDPTNNAPVIDEVTALSTLEETAVTGTIVATDADRNDILTYSVVSEGNGDVVIDATGNFTYTPNKDYFGTDSITFEVTDGKESAQVTVEIDVTNVDDIIPTPEEGTTEAIAGEVLEGDLSTLVTNVDGDDLTFTLTGQAANGTVVLNADGTFTYTPNDGFVGTDSFTYSVTDGTTTVTGTFTIEVSEAPLPWTPLTPATPADDGTDELTEVEDEKTENEANPETGSGSLMVAFGAITAASAGLVATRRRK